MRFINSAVYVQCQFNNKFHNYHAFCWFYINDMIVASETLEDHVHHLDLVFHKLFELWICLVSDKVYISFSSVKLLDQHVDSLEMSTSEVKIKAITDLKFLCTLQQLEFYLDLTEWFCSYIEWYAQITELLEKHKWLLAKSESNADKARKTFAKTAQLSLSASTELKAFHILQKIFANSLFLFHHDKIWKLFIDFDAMKSETDMKAMIYHVEGKLKYLKDSTKMTSFLRTHIQSIMFLSRLLNKHKQQYWSTELKVTCLIWVLHKIRHIIKTSE